MHGQFGLELVRNEEIAKGPLKKGKTLDGDPVWYIPIGLTNYVKDGRAEPWTDVMCSEAQYLPHDALPSAERDAQENLGVDMVLASARCSNGMECLCINDALPPHLAVFGPRRNIRERAPKNSWTTSAKPLPNKAGGKIGKAFPASYRRSS